MTELEKLFIMESQKLGIEIKFFLRSGIKIEGLVHSFDDKCIFVFGMGVTQLVYVEAIGTILPPEPLENFDIDGNK